MFDTLRYKYRHYFVRKKSPKSWIFWGEIMRRQSSSFGSLTSDVVDAHVNQGAPGDNYVEFNVYDEDNKLIGSTRAKVSYRSAQNIADASMKAIGIWNKYVREANAKDVRGDTSVRPKEPPTVS